MPATGTIVPPATVPPGSGQERVRPVILKGIPGSHGLAIGPTIIVGAVAHSFVRRTIKPHEADVEIGRFTDAVARAQEGIRQVVERVKSGHARGETSILDAYVQMLGDELILEGVERNIRINRQNAEWAVSNAIQDLCDKFEDMEDPYLVERRHDVAFVGERIVRALSGSDKSAALPKLARPSVILAHDLSPADTAALVKEPVVAIITEVGTRTSHTSIMARALEIPAVVGVADALSRIGPSDIVIVDGFRGEVTVAPTQEMITEAEQRANKHIALVRHLREDRDKQTATADGVAVHLRANIEFPAEALLAVDHGAEGIGLYRTEFLYVDRAAPPEEDEQYELYRSVIETVHPRPATLRTFDIGGDK
ncbi:MAG TPA: phosphoenolpyruvate-utilizing N-terminal domain-containing protein, partial [Polyangiaceae bacterium]|nr:phosphoenolpyruvate-utilizing N-terminal domain-containing protein [Polyangiaceae bacterium]